MKNKNRSSNADAGFDKVSNGGSSMFTMGTSVAPDIAGHEARQAIRRSKRKKLLTASIVICLVAVVSAFFAIYTTTDWFKASTPAPSDIVVGDPNAPTRVTITDHAAFVQAQRLGDFSGLSGGVDASVWVKPFLIGYKLTAQDDDIVKIANGKIYGWNPGITTITVTTADGQLVDTFTVEVLDANGRLYYSVGFYAESSDTSNDAAQPLYTLQVISGRAISDMSLQLPSFPSKLGYTAKYWTLDGNRFFDSLSISTDTKVYMTWDAKKVSFLSNSGDLDNGSYKTDYTVDMSDYADHNSASGSFVYSAANLPAGLSIDPASGIISGRPQAAGTYLFDVTATDTVQATQDRQNTSATKEFRLVVEKRVASISISDADLTYNGRVQTIPVQINNLAEGDVGNVTVTVNYIGSTLAGVKDAGSYTAKVVALAGGKSGNYDLPSTEIKRTFTVQPRVANIEFISVGSNFRQTYDGTEKTLSARVTNLADGDNCGIEISYSSADRTNVTAEGIVASVELLYNSNYTLPSSAITQRYYIDPASLTITIAEGQSKIYAAAEPTYQFVITGARTTADQNNWEGLIAYGISRAAGSNAGIYPFILDLSSLPSTGEEGQLQANYTVTLTNPAAVFTINPRSVSIVGAIIMGYNGGTDITDAAYSFSTFDATANTGLKAGDTLVLQGNFASKTVGENKAVTGIELTPDVASNNNYCIGSTHFGNITIRNITSINGITAQNKQYDGSAVATLNLSNMNFDGLKAGDDISISYTAAFASYRAANNIAVTVNSITLTGADKDNYTLPAGYSLQMAANITPIEISFIDGITAVGKVYDGQTALAANALSFANAKFGKNEGGSFQELKLAADIIVASIQDTYYSFVSATQGEQAVDVDISKITIDNTDYRLALTDINTITAVIARKELQIAGIFNKIYDGNTDVVFGVGENAAFAAGKAPVAGDIITYTGEYTSVSAGLNKGITFQLQGAAKDNYILTNPTLAGNITQKSVTVIGIFDKEYDATTNIIDSNLQLDGVIDNFGVALTGTYSSANVGARDVTFAITGVNAGNYQLTVAIVAAHISAKAITIDAGAQSKTYDAAVLSIDININMISGLVTTGLHQYTFEGSIKTADKKAEAAKLLTLHSFKILDNGADVTANYTFTDVQGSATITAKNLVLGGNFDKQYDANNTAIVSAITIDGIVAGDTVAIAGSYGSANAGAYAISFDLTGADKANYTINDIYTGTIAPKQLTISHTNSKTYDGSRYEVAVAIGMVSGLISGRSYTVTGTLVSDNKNVARDISNAVIAKALSLDGGAITILDSGVDVTANFDINCDNCKVTINPRLLTLTAANISANDKVYDGTTAVTFGITGAPSGLILGDSVTISSNTAAFDSKDAGLRNVIVPVASLAITSGNNNYEINYSGGDITSTATISPKPVTVEAKAGADFNKVYNGNNNIVAANYSVVGLVGSEAVTLTGTYSSASASATSYAIAFGLVSDTVSANYIIEGTYFGNINRKEVTITYNNSKVYDGNDNVIGAAIDSASIISGDIITIASAKYDSKLADTNKPLAFVLGGDDNSNYKLANIAYTASITKATLTVDFGASLSKIYDINVFTKTVVVGMLSGLMPSDTLNAGVYSTADANAAVNKPLVATTAIKLVDTASASIDTTACYTIVFVNDSATIEQRQITVRSELLADKIYDGTTNINVALQYDLVGTGMTKEPEAMFKVAAGDEVVLSSKNIGTQNANVSIALAGEHKGNYKCTNADNIVNVTINIIPRPVSIVGFGGQNLATALTKVYNKTNTVVIDGKVALQTANGSVAEGVVVGDNVTLTSGTYSTVTQGENIAITFVLSGTDADNYSLATGYTGTITRREITYKAGATADTKVYSGNTDAVANLSTVTFNNIIDGDEVTLASTSANFADKDAGTSKQVTIAGLTIGGADADNYTLTTSTITVYSSITAKPITATSITITKVYDANAKVIGLPALTGVLSADNDDVKISGMYYSDAAREVTTVDVVDALFVKFTITGAARGNYTLTNPDHSGTITPKAITAITDIIATDRQYNATTSVDINKDSAKFIGIIGDDFLKLGYASAAFADKNVSVSKNVIFSGIELLNADNTQSTNYTYTGGDVLAQAKITALPISSVSGITAEDKIYDSTTSATINMGSVTFAGMIAGDTLTLVSSLASGTFENKNVGSNKIVTVTGCELGGADKGNYTLSTTAVTARANITPKDITLNVPTITKIYDGTIYVTVTTETDDIIASDADDVVIIGKFYSDADRLYSTANVVDAQYVRFALSGAEKGNYSITNPNHNGTITARAITINNLAVANKTYDGKVSATIDTSLVTYGNLATGDTLVFGGATAVFDSKGFGEQKTATITGIVLYNADGITPNTNYSYASTAEVKANITKRTLYIDNAVDLNKQYDGNANVIATLTLVGIQSNDLAELDDVSVTGSYETKNSGVGLAVLYSMSGADKENYNIEPVTGSILKKELVVDVGNISTTKAYDGTKFAVTIIDAMAAAIADTDTISSGSAKSSSDVVGTYNLSLEQALVIKDKVSNSDVTGNYIVSFTTKEVIITQRYISVEEVDIGAGSYNKIYDGNNRVDLTKVKLESYNATTGTGLVASDSTQVELYGYYVNGLLTVKDVGNGITIRFGIQGDRESNYCLDNPDQTGDITHKIITISQNTNPDYAISMVFEGGYNYFGAFEKGMQYLMSDTVYGETLEYTVGTKLFDSPYVDATKITTTFTLTAAPANTNYKLSNGEGDIDNFVSKSFVAEITRQIANVYNTINPSGGTSVTAYMDDVLEVPIARIANGTPSFVVSYTKDIAATPLGLKWEADFVVYKLTKVTAENPAPEGAAIRTVSFGANSWWYDVNVKAETTGSSYKGFDNSLFYIVEKFAPYYLKSDPLDLDPTLDLALDSIGLHYDRSFIRIGNP